MALDFSGLLREKEKIRMKFPSNFEVGDNVRSLNGDCKFKIAKKFQNGDGKWFYEAEPFLWGEEYLEKEVSEKARVIMALGFVEGAVENSMGTNSCREEAISNIKIVSDFIMDYFKDKEQ